VFCQQARRRVDRLFHELWSNDDDDNYGAAREVLRGRFRWLEEGILDPSGQGPMVAEQPSGVGDTDEGEARAERAEAETDQQPATA
jgi:hypothetical protein